MEENSTIDEKEIKKFSAMAKEWYNQEGDLKHLHLMNPVRISFIKQKMLQHYNLASSITPFHGLEVIDIGCGGGILSGPMAKLGATVTGIDASSENIAIAKAAACKLGISVNYVNASIEEYSRCGKKYDVILCLEVLEHVNNIEVFFLI